MRSYRAPRHSRSIALVLMAIVALAPRAGAADTVEAGDAGTWAPPDDAIMRAFAAKDYAAADAACRAQLERQPTNIEATYGLACALAREGKGDDALAQLEAATTHGFCDAARALADDDLASLRNHGPFDKIIARMRTVPIGTGCPDEPGAEIPGLSTIERQPKGGLRFRLRLAKDATAARPDRLVLWMHPSGGSMDDIVEGHALDLAAHHCALCVFPRKQYIGWSDQEAAALTPTVADIATIPGVDAKKPILMGFSAGGQAALKLFTAAPSAWGAMLLDAAYPIDMDQATGKASLLVPGAAAGATHLPVLALVGGDDPNAHIWDMARQPWTQAGIRLTVRTVPHKRHQYLFEGDEWTATLAFLDGVNRARSK